jgi:hypothetical protein
MVLDLAGYFSFLTIPFLLRMTVVCVILAIVARIMNKAEPNFAKFWDWLWFSSVIVGAISIACVVWYELT